MNKKPGKDAGFGEVMRCGCVNHESESNALRRWERFYKRGNVGEIFYGFSLPQIFFTSVLILAFMQMDFWNKIRGFEMFGNLHEIL